MSKIISPNKVQAELNKLAKTTKTHSINDLRMVLALERVIARIEQDARPFGTASGFSVFSSLRIICFLSLVPSPILNCKACQDFDGFDLDY